MTTTQFILMIAAVVIGCSLNQTIDLVFGYFLDRLSYRYRMWRFRRANRKLAEERAKAAAQGELW